MDIPLRVNSGSAGHVDGLPRARPVDLGKRPPRAGEGAAGTGTQGRPSLRSLLAARIGH